MQTYEVCMTHYCVHLSPQRLAKPPEHVTFREKQLKTRRFVDGTQDTLEIVARPEWILYLTCVHLTPKWLLKPHDASIYTRNVYLTI